MAAEGDVWVLAHGGSVVRLRASRGLAMLARLVSEPGRELHVLDLGAPPPAHPASTRGMRDRCWTRRREPPTATATAISNTRSKKPRP